jgi:hypothetical protein
MRTKAFWPAVLSLALACGDGGTGPSIPTVGTIGPIPDGLTGKVAFVISGVVTSSGGSHVESKVHMIDMASPADRVIYTAPPNFSIQGLTWAPSAQNVVVQTTLFQVDPAHQQDQAGQHRPADRAHECWHASSTLLMGSADCYPHQS